MAKSARSSIETVADALSDAKDEVWERTFDIAKPQRSKRGRRAGKGVALLALVGGVGFIAAKKRETATSVAKTAAGKSTAVAKTAADKGSSAAKTAFGSIKARRNKS